MALEKLNKEVMIIMAKTESGKKFWNFYVKEKSRVMPTTKAVIYFEKFLEDYNSRCYDDK